MKNYRKLLLPALMILPLVMYSFKSNNESIVNPQIQSVENNNSLKACDAKGLGVLTSRMDFKRTKLDAFGNDRMLSPRGWSETTIQNTLTVPDMNINQIVSLYK